MAITSGTLPKSGYTKDTANSFLLNAGAWVKNLVWDKAESKWSYELIGATSGGSKLTLKNNYRQVEVDGVFTTPVGADMIESAEGTAELKLIELTVNNLKMLLLANAENSDGTDYPEGYEVIKPKSKIEISDYVKNMAYIGTISGSDKPVIVIFDYAICTSGLEVEPQDKQEAVYTVTFEARVDAENIDTPALPVTILYPKIVPATGAAAPMSATIDGLEKTEENDTKLTKGATK